MLGQGGGQLPPNLGLAPKCDVKHELKASAYRSSQRSPNLLVGWWGDTTPHSSDFGGNIFSLYNGTIFIGPPCQLTQLCHINFLEHVYKDFAGLVVDFHNSFTSATKTKFPTKCDICISCVIFEGFHIMRRYSNIFRCTQPGHPSVGRCNEYRPKGGDALWLGVKAVWLVFGDRLNCVNPCITCVISERFRG